MRYRALRFDECAGGAGEAVGGERERHAQEGREHRGRKQVSMRPVAASVVRGGEARHARKKLI